ncbi:MAG: DUF6308 family protein [Phycisphaerales bacterium JB038]
MNHATELVETGILSNGQQGAARELLKEYFDPNAPYTGAQFETLGGGWDRPESLCAITPSDLIALSTLSVPVTGRATVQILSAPFQRRAGEILTQIDPEVSIHDDAADDLLLDGDSPAWDLWRLFRPGHRTGAPNVDNFGQTRTAKLLARKRPRLFPVYDSVVTRVLGINSSVHHWTVMRDMATLHDGALIPRMGSLIAGLDLRGQLTPLRAVDVVLWMQGKRKGYEEVDE